MILPETLTIGQLAQRAGVARNTLWRRLVRLQAATGATWMARHGRHWAVNVARLQAEAPEFALPASVSERLEDHEDRLLALERAFLDASDAKKRRQKAREKRAS